uniref:Uncharacterized protein n=1 Tax=Neobodo designis TaxID=312471 RepID=A0A7S1R3T5_NEODS
MPPKKRVLTGDNAQKFQALRAKKAAAKSAPPAQAQHFDYEDEAALDFDEPENVDGDLYAADEYVRIDTPPGKVVARLAADYQPHPEEFALVAQSIGAELVRVDEAKSTIRPMSCTVTFPEEKDLSELLGDPFVVELGDRPPCGSWICRLQGQPLK